MHQCPYSEADSSSASQEIPHISTQQKFHYPVFKAQVVTTLSQVNLVHARSLFPEDQF